MINEQLTAQKLIEITGLDSEGLRAFADYAVPLFVVEAVDDCIYPNLNGTMQKNFDTVLESLNGNGLCGIADVPTINGETSSIWIMDRETRRLLLDLMPQERYLETTRKLKNFLADMWLNPKQLMVAEECDCFILLGIYSNIVDLTMGNPELRSVSNSEIEKLALEKFVNELVISFNISPRIISNLIHTFDRYFLKNLWGETDLYLAF
ncbi:hypothetical protein M0R04_02595 [Candidatus Dojkabacteria bacterium]|jgi:hypothetical protein|nr:hypothetical protein [Candidatus Dojkabacteria bacterium]